MKLEDFEKALHEKFDPVWDSEIDHPMFQDTVGELMDEVIQLHNKYAQPKQGEWVFRDGKYACENCGYNRVLAPYSFNYCPVCGARMIRESEITCLHSDHEVAQSLVDDLNSLTEEQWAELENARMVQE